MTPKFTFPDHWTAPDRNPAPQPVVDPHLVGHLVNGFIAGKQAALYEADDAFYRKKGIEALSAAPGVVAHLNEMRETALQHIGDEARDALASQLEAQLHDALDGINRHVAEQHKEFGREVLAERQRLIERAAALDHNNDDKLLGLAAASASVAGELARLNGEPEGPAIQAARSTVWRSAIDQRLEGGHQAEAFALFDRVRAELVPADLEGIVGRRLTYRPINEGGSRLGGDDYSA